MYHTLKSMAMTVLPRRVLVRWERGMRAFIYLFYLGSRYRCNLCGKTLRRFIGPGEDGLCPFCGSLARDRRLWMMLQQDFLQEGARVLDFSPSRPLYRALVKTPGIHYQSSDLSGDFHAAHAWDITRLPLPEQSADLILCYHVLEHVEQDLQAMKELLRVLAPGGHCILQTPFREGDILEDARVKTPLERKRLFGQEDHVRVYSVSGLKKRLESCGFRVEVRAFREKKTNLYGLHVEEYVLICIRQFPLLPSDTAPIPTQARATP